MTSIVAKYVTKNILGETVANNFGTEDPYFERVPATRLNGRPSSSRTKKVKKALPPGISEQDGKVLTKVKRRAYRLDMSLCNCCGIRFGWSSVIGLVPGIGDVIDCLLALMVMRTCMQIEGGLPASVKTKMLFNIALDFVVGLVPFLGDVADAVFRANTRNAVELEKFLRARGKKNLKARGQESPDEDPTNPEEFDREMRHHHGDGYAEGVAPKKPERKSWFGGSSQARQPDLESGHRLETRAPDRPPRPNNGSSLR